jgi:hypothetical protein
MKTWGWTDSDNSQNTHCDERCYGHEHRKLLSNSDSHGYGEVGDPLTLHLSSRLSWFGLGVQRESNCLERGRQIRIWPSLFIFIFFSFVVGGVLRLGSEVD